MTGSIWSGERKRVDLKRIEAGVVKESKTIKAVLRCISEWSDWAHMYKLNNKHTKHLPLEIYAIGV